MLTRRSLLASQLTAGVYLFTPSIIRAQVNTPKTFFAGCYYDTAVSNASMLSRYLISPIRTNMNLTQDGAELTPFVVNILDQRKDFSAATGLNQNNEGNPIAISVTRAQHEIITVLTPGLPPEYLTTISVSAAFDVMTDQAAFRNQSRFESIYSNMIIVNQVIHGRNKVGDADLVKYYQMTFKAAIDELLERAIKSMKDNRERASAVFQVKNMVLPQQLPPDLEALIASGIEASADQNANARDEELKKLTREIKHIYSLMIMDALNKAKITNMAILPPESPWAEARVLSRLKERLRINAEILTQPDATRMNGFEIRAGITDVARSKSGSTSQVNVTMGSRIVRVNANGATDHMPIAIKDPMKKVAVNTGARSFVDSTSFKRGVTRDITMAAIRDAAEGTAQNLVPHIKATANEM